MKNKLLSLIIVVSSLNIIKSQNFAWSKSVGSTGNDMGHVISVDPSGNVITVGSFSNSVDFDPSALGVQNLNALNGSTGIFISKLSPAGTYIWAKSFDGPSIYNWVRSMDTDANGNVYIFGEFGAVTDFDPSPSATYTLAPIGATDMFVCKLDASGNFVWAFNLGGVTNSDFANTITTDAAGNVYVIGHFSQTVDFDPSPTGTNTLSSIGGSDVFICKYTSAGGFVWARRFGGGGGTSGGGLAVDAAQNVYATGMFNGVADLDPDPAVATTFTSAGQLDMFVTKLNASGTSVWVKQIGGPLHQHPYSIALDANSNIYLSGTYEGTTDFDPSSSTYTLAPNAGGDMFISKLDANGSFMWAHSFGSNTIDNDAALSIAVSSLGNIFTTGAFYGNVDFNPSPTATSMLASSGSGDTFVSKLDANGNFVWTKQLSGTSYDLGQGIAVDAAENVYTTGAFYDVVDHDPSPITSYTLSSNGLYDIFISKLTAAEPSTVGFTNISGENSLINLYPNPTNGLLTVKTNSYENTNVALYNLVGQKVLSVKLENLSTTLDLEILSQGIYQLELIQNNVRVYQSKIIKSK